MTRKPGVQCNKSMKRTLQYTAGIFVVALIALFICYAIRAIQFACMSVSSTSTRIIDDFSSKNTGALALDVPLALPKLKKGIMYTGARDRRYYALYICYFYRGETDQANRAIQDAYRLSPANPIYAMMYGLQIKMAGRNREARDFFLQQERRTGRSLTWDVMVAGIDMSIQDYSDARPLWEGMLNATPAPSTLDKSMALAELGECYLYQGNQNAAIDCLNQSIESAPTVINHTLLGEAHLKLYNPRASVGEFDLALKVNPRYDRALYLKGLALSRLGNEHSAIELFKNALISNMARTRMNDDEGGDFYLQGLIETALGLDAPAQESFERAGKLGFTYGTPNAPVKYPHVRKKK